MANVRRWLLLLTGSLLLADIAAAQDFAAKGFKLARTTPHEFAPEDLEAGKGLYAEHCAQCHGEDGDGQGVVADLLDPRPRDFQRGIYKIRLTPQGELPTDDDLFRIIAGGMPGTSMPAWRASLSDPQIWQLVAHVKSFSADFADFPAEQQFVLEGKPDASPESLERGAKVYEKAECAKCHGASGRGNGPSAAELEDEWGFPIYPADLTRPWTLRGGGSVEDVYRTLATGVNGTPMPSFSDAWNSEDLWHLANYIHSIGRDPLWGEIIRAAKTDAVPQDADAPAWEQAPVLDVRLLGQIIQEPRLFNPSVQSLTVQALFDEKELALLLTWTDRFENKGQDGKRSSARSEQGREAAAQRGEAERSVGPREGGQPSGDQDDKPTDRVAVLFPAQALEEGKKPYFLMGDRQRPVDVWQWSVNGTESFLARGMDQLTPRASSVIAQAVYRDGQYRVVLRRSLETDQDSAVEFAAGKMIPIACNVWDGQNAEDGKQRAISRWYYLLLEPETPRTTWLWPLVVVFLAAGGEAIGMRRLRQRWR